ncbi:MAG: outer membrane beta-barrel protein [Chromatiales bacterium]|nr:outer membrane beta-barrel protein [Chromatiales bacterium]
MTASFARSPLARSPLVTPPPRPSLVRSPGVAALPRIAAAALAGAAVLAPASVIAADDWSGGPRYSYFDAGYQWVDSLYGVKQEGGQHEGFQLNGSVGLAQFDRIGIHLFGEFFDGDFSGVQTTCGTGEGSSSVAGDRNSQALAGGLGASFALAETTDIVVRAAYVDITDFETPNDLCQLVSGDDTGYYGEVMVRSELSQNVEIEAGFRYADLSDSNVSDNSVLLGIGYHLTDYLTIRARGVVFDDDTGIEIGARLYFGSFLGRDTLF